MCGSGLLVIGVLRLINLDCVGRSGWAELYFDLWHVHIICFVLAAAERARANCHSAHKRQLVAEAPEQFCTRFPYYACTNLRPDARRFGNFLRFATSFGVFALAQRPTALGPGRAQWVRSRPE